MARPVRALEAESILMYIVYLAQCEDGSIYTGITNDLERRLKQHREGKGAAYTRSHPIQKILRTEQFRAKGRALKREAEIKSWPREKKLALIESGTKHS